MEDYVYRGFTISYNDDDNYEIILDGETIECVSYEDAVVWIDAYLEMNPVEEFHTYRIYFATKDYNRGYCTTITAYNEDDAIKQLKRENPDLAYISDLYEVDNL